MRRILFEYHQAAVPVAAEHHSDGLGSAALVFDGSAAEHHGDGAGTAALLYGALAAEHHTDGAGAPAWAYISTPAEHHSDGLGSAALAYGALAPAEHHGDGLGDAALLYGALAAEHHTDGAGASAWAYISTPAEHHSDGLGSAALAYGALAPAEHTPREPDSHYLQLGGGKYALAFGALAGYTTDYTVVVKLRQRALNGNNANWPVLVTASNPGLPYYSNVSDMVQQINAGNGSRFIGFRPTDTQNYGANNAASLSGPQTWALTRDLVANTFQGRVVDGATGTDTYAPSGGGVADTGAQDLFLNALAGPLGSPPEMTTDDGDWQVVSILIFKDFIPTAAEIRTYSALDAVRDPGVVWTAQQYSNYWTAGDIITGPAGVWKARKGNVDFLLTSITSADVVSLPEGHTAALAYLSTPAEHHTDGAGAPAWAYISTPAEHHSDGLGDAALAYGALGAEHHGDGLGDAALAYLSTPAEHHSDGLGSAAGAYLSTPAEHHSDGLGSAALAYGALGAEHHGDGLGDAALAYLGGFAEHYGDGAGGSALAFGGGFAEHHADGLGDVALLYGSGFAEHIGDGDGLGELSGGDYIGEAAERTADGAATWALVYTGAVAERWGDGSGAAFILTYAEGAVTGVATATARVQGRIECVLLELRADTGVVLELGVCPTVSLTLNANASVSLELQLAS